MIASIFSCDLLRGLNQELGLWRFGDPDHSVSIKWEDEWVKGWELRKAICWRQYSLESNFVGSKEQKWHRGLQIGQQLGAPCIAGDLSGCCEVEQSRENFLVTRRRACGRDTAARAVR